MGKDRRPLRERLATGANAICYSGYRENQSPIERRFPTRAQISEDLHILKQHWRFLRLYDCSPHAETVLQVIREERLNFQVMLGADMAAEASNPGCPWGADFDEQTLWANRRRNSEEIGRLIALATAYPDIVFSVSIGNEASVEWTDHLVPLESLVRHARRVKKSIRQPVTFCENHVPWIGHLEPLAEVLDFVSLHTYPVWEYQPIDNALEHTVRDYERVRHHYPDKPVIITEAGWTTASNGRGIEPWNASQTLQAEYHRKLLNWSRREKILTFVFEAFDEPWKGSPDPLEPEKHWGLFTVDRQPKLVMREVYA